MLASLFEMHDFPDRISAVAPAPEAMARRSRPARRRARRRDFGRSGRATALITFAVTAGILWPAAQPTVSVKPVARGYGGYAA